MTVIVCSEHTVACDDIISTHMLYKEWLAFHKPSVEGICYDELCLMYMYLDVNWLAVFASSRCLLIDKLCLIPKSPWKKTIFFIALSNNNYGIFLFLIKQKKPHNLAYLFLSFMVPAKHFIVCGGRRDDTQSWSFLEVVFAFWICISNYNQIIYFWQHGP